MLYIFYGRVKTWFQTIIAVWARFGDHAKVDISQIWLELERVLSFEFWTIECLSHSGPVLSCVILHTQIYISYINLTFPRFSSKHIPIVLMAEKYDS